MNKQIYCGLAVLIVCGILAFYAKFDQPLYISPQAADIMGKQIWHNECGRKIEGLTCWNKGEEFASLGIGHFIWYPRHMSGPFKQLFPDFLKFLKQEGTSLPKWLAETDGCPWQSREEFYEAQDSQEMAELRQVLLQYMDLQIIFMINRLHAALPSILKALPSERKPWVITQFYRLTRSSAGIYALLDYLNFKGEGISSKECYQGEGWGLLQVLEKMSGDCDPVQEFAAAAKQVLARRVAHSPPERNEQRWLKGWYNRIDTYLNFSI